MQTTVIQDWTTAHVPLTGGAGRDVKYRVYRADGVYYEEVRELDDAPIHTLELPSGIALEKASYEVLLRYVLQDVVGA